MKNCFCLDTEKRVEAMEEYEEKKEEWLKTKRDMKIFTSSRRSIRWNEFKNERVTVLFGHQIVDGQTIADNIVWYGNPTKKDLREIKKFYRDVARLQ